MLPPQPQALLEYHRADELAVDAEGLVPAPVSRDDGLVRVHVRVSRLPGPACFAPGSSRKLAINPARSGSAVAGSAPGTLHAGARRGSGLASEGIGLITAVQSAGNLVARIIAEAEDLLRATFSWRPDRTRMHRARVSPSRSCSA